MVSCSIAVELRGSWTIMVKGIWGLSGPQPPCWRNQYQTSHVDKISNEAGLS
jgi:hypothetical protein